jgi:hypothetical protein
MLKYLSSFIAGPAGVILILLFFLPWVTISCTGVKIEASGYDLATGNALDELEQLATDLATGFTTGIDQELGGESSFSFDTPATTENTEATGVAALGAVALRFSITQSSQLAGIIYLMAGILGLAIQLVKYFDLQDLKRELESQTAGEQPFGISIIEFSYEPAWWLTMVALAAIIIAGLVVFLIEQAPPASQTVATLKDEPLPTWMESR